MFYGILYGNHDMVIFMRKRFNVEKKSHTGKFITIAILAIVISVGSIFTVMANTLDCMVIDGDDVYEFSLLSPSETSILNEAVDQGMQPLSEDDYIISENLTLIVKRSLVVSVDQGSSTQTLKAIEGDVLEDVLESQDINITDNDIIDIPLDTVLSEDIKVNIGFYTPVTVIVDGVSYDTVVYSATVGDALNMLDISVEEGDVITPELDTYVEYDSEIYVQSENTVTLIYQNEEAIYDTFSITVQDFLTEVGIELGEYDEVSPSLDSHITDGLEITVDVVTFEETVEIQSIAYSTVKAYSSSMYSGESSVTTKGVDGEKEVVYTDKYVNGEYVETLEPVETIISEAVSKVITYGTKEKEVTDSNTNSDNSSSDSSDSSTSSKTFVDYNGNTVSYSSVTVGECTAYTATGNPTSLGGVAQVGVVAVDPSIIPYGTKMYITSGSVVYGYAVAGDTGGALLAGNVLIDLYYDTESECINFGRRDMTIYFLD